MVAASSFFMPYQEDWLDDDSRIKIWEKSRRIGATYVQSYEDVRDCIRGNVDAVWFSSADLTAAREYIEYCFKWARVYNYAAEDLGERVVDEKKGVKAFGIKFDNGSRINALSSNPTQFRSKGGKVILDEFAWHDDQDAMWAAARPVITWGYPLRILSTHNGKACRYYKFIERIKKGELKKWSHHVTTIINAVDDGLADKILKRDLTEAERQEWLKEEEENVGDHNTWLQEYLCIPVDEATAFLTYNMIEKCERDDIYRPLDDITGDLYIGMDIARRKHLSVIWGIELIHDIKLTRFVTTMEKTKYARQREVLYNYLQHRTMRRSCLDSTGIGNQLSEEAQDKFGKFRVEQVNFTNASKADMAHSLYIAMEDVRFLIPSDFTIRESFHSLRKITTSANNIRLDASENKKTGSHADEFWSAALANHAVSDYAGPVRVGSAGTRSAHNLVRGYDDDEY